MVHGAGDPAFPRLGQLIVDYESPLKKLSEEFVPHARVLTRALLSLAAIYPRRNLSADQWRSAQVCFCTQQICKNVAYLVKNFFKHVTLITLEFRM